MNDNQNNMNFYNTNNNQDSLIPSLDEGSILEAPMAPPADEEVAEMPETPLAPEIPVAPTISDISETPSAPEVPETPSVPVVNDVSSTNTEVEIKNEVAKEEVTTPVVNNTKSREISVSDQNVNPLEEAYVRNKKKKPSSTFILLLILAIFIFLFRDRLLEFFTNLNIPSPNDDIQEPLVTPSDDIVTPSDDVVTPSDDVPEEEVQTPVPELIWNGVYSNGNNIIKIYKISSSEIYYSTSGENLYMSSFLDLSDNKASKEFFGDTTTFTLDGNTLNVTSTSDSIVTGTYTKKSDYTENNCYEDNIGELKYITSNINGIFKKDDVVIKIFQSKIDTGRILITKSNSQYSKEFKIVDEKIELNDESFGEIEKISAEISGSTLTITASETDSSGLLNQISGTYTKSSSYSLSDILDDNLY